MLSPGTDVYLRFPEPDGQRVLLPGTVLLGTGDTLTIELAAPLPLSVGQELLIYYEIERKFVQRPVRVDALIEGAAAMLALRPLGDPVSAESRECYRVSTITADLTASVGPEPGCPLIDVSPTGFAVIATQPYAIGNVIDVCIGLNGRMWCGRGCVQSVRELAGGRIRYGLHCVEQKRLGASDLLKGLQMIATEVQRAQLRRRSGA